MEKIKLCKYCKTKLENKKIYENSFVMDYCPKCDIFFPKSEGAKNGNSN